MNFVNDKLKTSVTSGLCQWVRRIVDHSSISPIENMDISLHGKGVSYPLPTEHVYNPFSKHCDLPSVQSFMKIVSKDLPSACCLDTNCVKPVYSECHKVLHLHTLTPSEKLEQHFQCIPTPCETCDSCFENILETLIYKL